MRRALNRTVLIFLAAALAMTAGCKMTVTGNDPQKASYTITYDANGHGCAPEKKTVEEGYKLT